MKCPNPSCDKELAFAAGESPLYNADQYSQDNRALTSCCKNFMYVRPVRSYNITISNDQTRADDWGHEK